MRNKADKLVKKMAMEREYELARRRKREVNLPRGPGNIITGHVNDCSRSAFEKALKNYWNRLFVGWNPYKKDGIGCWEVWQTPSKKQQVLQYEDEDAGIKVFTHEYVYSDYLHWVADLEYLDMNFIKRLREMDAWEDKQLLAKHDDAYEAHFEKLEREEDENIKYVVKENKRVFRDLLDYVQSGYNPLDFYKGLK